MKPAFNSFLQTQNGNKRSKIFDLFRLFEKHIHFKFWISGNPVAHFPEVFPGRNGALFSAFSGNEV